MCNGLDIERDEERERERKGKNRSALQPVKVGKSQQGVQPQQERTWQWRGEGGEKGRRRVRVGSSNL